MTPMPRRIPELPIQIRDSQPSTSNTPKLTSATEKGKIAQFATQVKELSKK